MKDFEAKTSPRQKMDTESWFIECYRNNQDQPCFQNTVKNNVPKSIRVVGCHIIDDIGRNDRQYPDAGMLCKKADDCQNKFMIISLVQMH